MQKTGYYTEQYTQDFSKKLKDITSLSISNVGETDSTLIIQGVKRIIKPKQIFVIEGDGSYSDVDFKFTFDGGSGIGIVDYRQIKQC